MTDPAAPDLTRDIAAAIDWWRGAGVDCDFADEPARWLAPPEAERPSDGPPPRRAAAPVAPPEEPRLRIGGDPAGWPGDLAAWRDWWLAEPSLDGGNVHGRVAPRGEAGAALLVLVDHPEPGDRDVLLAGEDGALLAAFLAAAGIGAEGTSIAAALPRHTPHADWPALAAQGLGDLLAHQVRLFAPQRIIAFSANILPLLGHDPAKNAAFSLGINQEGPSVPVMAARELSALRSRPKSKAALWRSWLDWTG